MNRPTLLKAKLFSVVFLFSLHTWATGYPATLSNYNLKEDIQDQGDRMIPKSDWFSAAVDGQVYFRTLGVKEFYHSVGYFVQARTEARLQDHFRLNVRSIFYAGSASYGYSDPSESYHLFGFSGYWPEAIFGGRIEGRAVDLGRQTIGQGLMVEEKEMNGLWLKWSRNSHSFRMLWDGTGSLLRGDDMLDMEIQLFDGYIGAGIMGWAAGKKQSGLAENRKPLYYITSAHRIFEGFSYFLEAGSREDVWGELLGFKYELTSGGWHLNTRLQGRHYDDNFARDFAGQIQQMYVSYDQFDKRFTNAGNIFVYDDNVNIYSLILDFDYAFNEEWEFSSRNEVGQMDFQDIDNKDFYYYRVGLTYYPIAGRRESITFFNSNKVLADSYAIPPHGVSTDNLPLFKNVNFLGVEAAFSF